MNRFILALLLSGSLIGMSKLIFYFLPLHVFQCTLTTLTKKLHQSLCSLARFTATCLMPPRGLPPAGEITHVLVVWVLPIALSAFLVFGIRGRSNNSSATARSR